MLVAAALLLSTVLEVVGMVEVMEEEEAKERELDDEKRYALRNHANVIR